MAQAMMLLKALSFFVGVVGLIYLSFYLYKKKLGARTKSEKIALIERCIIDQRTTISLVRIDACELIIVTQPNAIAVKSLPKEVKKHAFTLPDDVSQPRYQSTTE